MKRPDPRLAQLAALAGMARDARLAALAAAQARVAAETATLAGIAPPPGLEDDPAALHLAAARTRWYEASRSRANTRLAAATTAALDARSDAATALARAEALHALARRTPPRK